MLKIDLSKQTKKFLQSVHPKHAKQLASKIQSLRVNPRPNDSKKIDKYLRADCGEFRILYLIDNDVLKVILVGKRNDDEVYKMLGRIK